MNFQLGFFFHFKSLALGALLLGGCFSSTPKNVSMLAPEVVPDFGKKISRLGYNTHPSFSPDGQRIAFISSQREGQRNSELYILNLSDMSEERWTHQDGEIFDLFWNPQGGIFFTSTTDELKERPLLLFPELKGSPYPLTDLYWHPGRRASVFNRQQKEPGYVGQLGFSLPQRNSLVFLKEDGNKLSIQEWNWVSRKAQTLHQSTESLSWPLRLAREVLWVNERHELVSKDKKVWAKDVLKVKNYGDSTQHVVLLKKNSQLVLRHLTEACEQILFDAQASAPRASEKPSYQIHSWDFHPRSGQLVMSLNQTSLDAVSSSRTPAQGRENSTGNFLALRVLDPPSTPCLP